VAVLKVTIRQEDDDNILIDMNDIMANIQLVMLNSVQAVWLLVFGKLCATNEEMITFRLPTEVVPVLPTSLRDVKQSFKCPVHKS
jgi:hypothetical protein